MEDTGGINEKTATFLPLFPPFYLAACVGALLSVALFGCVFSIGLFLWVNSIYTLYFSEPNNQDLFESFLCVYQLLFLYLGCFPKIIELNQNGIISDNSEMVSKYNSSSNFESLNSVFVTIDETTINAEITNKFKALHPYPMYSMQHLVSDYYNHVVTNHKITLLLHVIEGIFTNYLSKNEQKKAKQPDEKYLHYKNMIKNTILKF